MKERGFNKKNLEITSLLNTDIESIRIAVSSPEEILAWSHGEVTKPETINYRTQKPEREGLFDERIFGPTKDWECYCGKYKKIRYKGVICDKCGVEVTRSIVRRERMGHIGLAVPVAHIWYVHGVPSVLGLLLDLSLTELERVIYFSGYIILEVNESIKNQTLEQLEHEYHEIKKSKKYSNQSPELVALDASYRQTKNEISSLVPKKVITEMQYLDISLKYGAIVKVGIGAEAIYKLLKSKSMIEIKKELESQLENAIGAQRRKIMRRMRLVMDMADAHINPESLILTQLPVLPPDLRPMVQLDGGRFAASDLNDLYRRVINRNNRLKRLAIQGAPEVICRNEKRMLQEAVDALIDNSARSSGQTASTGAGRKLRSLSDMLRGKQGRFRQNLLGKRVDYSGRSVIVVGADLKLDQCGLPKVMALELFKPFVISRLIDDGHVHNVKNATRMIDRGEDVVWDILESITDKYFVMLNRAPTLHRLGIQAFKPILIEGKAIQIHPLVCYAFNADFDGDQMAVHVPLSKQAFIETSEIMRSTHNLLKPASGEPVISPRLDIILGCYYITKFLADAKGEGKVFSSKNEAILAYQQDYVHVRAKIKVRIQSHNKPDKPGEIIETSVGRILFNNIIPDQMQFLNEIMDSKTLKKTIKDVYDNYGQDITAEIVDKIKNIGFEYAGQSGLTISMADVNIPSEKNEIIKLAESKLDEIDSQYRRGLITDYERSVKTIELWSDVRDQIEEKMIDKFDKESPVFMMVSSGARGSVSQVTQLAGMKGLVVNPAGEIIELPIKANYKEGLSVLEYFISTHGARKGKSDTALRTSDAGYLTRRLVDVAQDVIVVNQDCGTKEFLIINKQESEDIGQALAKRIVGRIAAENIFIPTTKKLLVAKNTEINEKLANKIEQLKIENVAIRTPLGCQEQKGICQMCYGRDLATGKLVKLGEVVGIMAAQAIGEPGTQLTMKTFHLGGVKGEDITSGLPRVEELFEARTPSQPAYLSEVSGKVKISENKDQKIITIISPQLKEEKIEIPENYKLVVKEDDIVKPKQVIALNPDKKSIRATIHGKITKKGNLIIITSTERITKQYILPQTASVKVSDGQDVLQGTELSIGSLDLSNALKLKGKIATQKYIIKEIQEIYSSQGQDINDKHIETIIRQMFSKVKILEPEDTNYLVGQVVDKLNILKENIERKNNKKPEIKHEEIVMGITRISLKTESFFSAASFQETTSTLIDAAVRGATDKLTGLKENVIIGKLIPAGTGYYQRKK